ncbi:MAG TPA: ATP-grasp domain-containing protein [Acidimicrobiales bacterium]|nr:ATP-grasp domain-containing protein [Acidimicrobiales bacterium]
MALTIIVTGAGGPAGVAVIRALRGQGHRVVAADADPSAVGLRLADEAAVLPLCRDAAFDSALAALARRTEAHVLISTVAEELGTVDVSDVDGLRTWFPTRDAVARCVDKWAFAKTMDDAGIPVPTTNLGSTADVPGPWIVKPRFGRGSRDVYRADSESDAAWALRRVEDPIVQTRVEGREFTVDALVDRAAVLVGVVPRWRDETRGGISTKGETFTSDELTSVVADVLGAVGLTGPANVQGFMGDDGPTIVEVNPRFSGGLPLSLAAGADLVGEYVRGILGLPPRPERLVPRAGVRMMRFFDEVFEG